MTQARILIVEDDPDTARLLEIWLRSSHFQHTGTASTGQEAIALASSSRPDLVIMDIVLPGDLDGIQTAGILQARFDVPVLYLTAYSDEALFERARVTSPSAYLNKPFSDRELKRAVEVALDRHDLLIRLKASEAHLAEAQAVAHIGSWRWDLQQDQVEASAELLRLLDLSAGTFEPRFDSFLQQVSADDQPKVLQTIASLLNGDDPGEFDISIPRVQDHPRMLRVRCAARFNDNGQAYELVGTARDVTNEWMARQEAVLYRTQLEEKVAQRTADLDATNTRLEAEVAEHLKTGERLWKSEARYRSLVDNLPDAIFVMQDERVVFVNPAAVRLAGVQSPDELLGKTLADLAHPDSRKFIEARKQAALSSKNPNPKIAYSFLRSDGRAVEVESISFAIEYDGRPAFLGVVHDLTEQRRIEQSAERFRVALDSSADAIFLIDPTAMRIVDVNETACNSLGYARSELLERGPHDIKPHYDKTRLRERFDQVLAGKPGAEIIQTVHQRKDGSTFPVEVSLRPFESGGRPLMVVVARDIAQRKQAEQALIESEERYRAVVEDQTELISRLRVDGTFIFANEVYCRFFGKTIEELVGQTWHPTIFPEDQPKIEATLGTLSPSNPVVVIENRVVSASGELHWMQFVNRAFFDGDGRIVEIQSVGRDITDRKTADMALREAEDFKRAVLDAVSTQVAVLDQTGTIIAINASWRNFAVDNSNVGGQAAAHTGIGTNYLSICLAAQGMSAEGAQDVAQGIRAVLDGSINIFNYEYPCHAPQKQRWFLMTVTPLGSARGGAVVSHSDITSPRMLAEKLLESEASLERAQSIAHIGSWKLDLQTSQLDWSAETYRIFCVPVGTPMTLERFLACVHPDDREAVSVAWNAAIRGTPYDIEHRIQVGGEVKWVREQAEIRLNAAGQPETGFGSVQEITATKLAEQERLAHETKQRNALVREVHHRIKNNLQGVIGLLRQHIADHPDTQPTIEAAIAQINTVAVVHGLQSRIPQNELRLRELLHEVCGAAATLAMVPQLPAIVDTLSGEVWLDSSASVSIALILNELIHNALKHNRNADGSGVDIALAGNTQRVSIHICNPDGPLPENLCLATGQGCGTGLGLVRTLLPRHGAVLNFYEGNGRITAEFVLSPPVTSTHGHVVRTPGQPVE